MVTLCQSKRSASTGNECDKAHPHGGGRIGHTAKAMVAFLIGAAPWLVVIALFKQMAGEANTVISGETASRLGEYAFSLERHAIIGSWLAKVFGGFMDNLVTWAVALCLILSLAVAAWGKWTQRTTDASIGRRSRTSQSAWWVALVVGTVAAGYYVIYLQKPLDLNMHLQTSLLRLLFHLWPLSVFWLALVLPGEDSVPKLTTPQA